MKISKLIFTERHLPKLRQLFGEISLPCLNENPAFGQWVEEITGWKFAWRCYHFPVSEGENPTVTFIGIEKDYATTPYH